MRFGFNDRDLRRAMKMAAMAGSRFGAGFGTGFGPDGPFGPHGPFGGHGPFGHGGGGRRGRKMFDRAELRLVLLRLIADQPRHGYDLIKALEELSGGQYSPSPGVVYPALAMLADEGLVAEQASDDQRRAFAVTAAGETVLEEESGAVAAAMARLQDLAERAERHRSPSIERASVNLFTAVGQRMRSRGEEGRGDISLRIAEVLDEAAQKIERL